VCRRVFLSPRRVFDMCRTSMCFPLRVTLVERSHIISLRVKCSLEDGHNFINSQTPQTFLPQSMRRHSSTRNSAFSSSCQQSLCDCHRDPLPCATLVFKNGLLRLSNFPSRNMAPFCNILIFNYSPNRLV